MAFRARRDNLLRLYDAAASADLWPSVLHDLAHDANSVGCCIAIDNVTETLIAPPMSPELVEPLTDFIESGWYTQDLRGRLAWPLLKEGRTVLIEHDVTTEEERRHSSYHNEWLRPWDLPWWGAIGFSVDDVCYALAILRSSEQGPFSRTDVVELARWRPHLTRAVSLARLIAQRMERTALDTLQHLDRAAFLLSVSGRIDRMNAAAEALLGSELELREGKLRAPRRQDDAALQRLLAAVLAPPFPSTAADEQPIAIGPEEGRRLMIEALPSVGLVEDVFARTRALLMVTDLRERAAPDERRLRELFRLTPAEAAVANRLVSGATVRDAAESLQIATGTARNHLKAIFLKTGTHRQSELVALIQKIRHR